MHGASAHDIYNIVEKDQLFILFGGCITREEVKLSICAENLLREGVK